MNCWKLGWLEEFFTLSNYSIYTPFLIFFPVTKLDKCRAKGPSLFYCFTIDSPFYQWFRYSFVYIYCHPQTVLLYHNSSVWLDLRNASSRDRNSTDFMSVRYLTVTSAYGFKERTKTQLQKQRTRKHVKKQVYRKQIKSLKNNRVCINVLIWN